MARRSGRWRRFPFRLTPRHSASLSRLGAILALLGAAQGLSAQQSQRTLTLATTTSVRDSRLLEQLLPAFERQSGIGVRVIAVGSGQALEMGRRGEADLLIVHDPEGEVGFVEGGFGAERVPLMYNDFVLVGPPGDPARVRGVPILQALARIAAAGTRIRFVSRADRSGTHAKELRLWREAGVEPRAAWYRESGQGMSATLQIANELQAYALSDRGTFASHRYPLDLEVLVAGDSVLVNPYHVLVPSAERFPWLNAGGARALTEYLTSPAARERIRASGLFTPLLPATPEG